MSREEIVVKMIEGKTGTQDWLQVNSKRLEDFVLNLEGLCILTEWSMKCTHVQDTEMWARRVRKKKRRKKRKQFVWIHPEVHKQDQKDNTTTCLHTHTPQASGLKGQHKWFP